MALPPSLSGGFGADVPPLRQTGHQVDEGVVQPYCIVRDRTLAEQGGVQRGMSHTLFLEFDGFGSFSGL